MRGLAAHAPVSSAMAKEPKLRVVPLGGCGEIGKNMTVIELGDDALIIDTGVMFPSADMLGVDLIIPDFSYLRERKNLKVHGILYTHGHEDHTGAVSYVVDLLRGTPLYATPMTAALLEVKLRDARLLQETKLNVFRPGEGFQIGPFKVESFHMTHSIPDCVGFAISTPYGLIVHSGDYKFDNTPLNGLKPDYAKMGVLANQGVLMLLADSTGAERPGWTPSETVVQAGFEDIFREAKDRIVVASFASHISRIQMISDLAARFGRKLAIAGHSMTENVKMARKMGLLQIEDEMLVDLNKISHIPPNKLVIVATGSQGEPSAVLSRLANGTHKSLDVMVGDTIVISAHTIPGNEEMVSRTINKLFQRGALVLYDPISPVHVSGHASQEEMKLLISLLSPKFFIPVHGELRHLKAHRALAIQSGIPGERVFVVENGMVVEADRNGARLTGERVPGGYVFVDGSGVGDVGRAVIRDRETLARDGFVMVVVNVDGGGHVLTEPEIVTRGFVYLREADELIEQIRETIYDVMSSSRDMKNGKRREKLENSLSRLFFNETRRRPMVFSVINER
jgi:ribonuclease J